MPNPPAPQAQPTTPLTFAQADRLGLLPFCQRLEQFLIVESDYVDGSLVTALNASFGRGKTTFLEMWKNELLTRRQTEMVPLPVILNAWESDYCNDPLVAILAGLLQAVDTWKGKDAPTKAQKTTLRERAQKFSLFTVAIANGVAAKHTGVDILKAVEYAEDQHEEAQPEVPDFIKLFNARKTALDDLKKCMSETFSGTSPKVFVFVDELDRCRPDYAISYLETIKHVFDVKGMVFVLAVDAKHLSNSARSLFGSDLDFPEYFRKFCHRSFDLPQPDNEKMQPLIAEYVKKYMAIAGKRDSFFEFESSELRNVVRLIGALEMTPRQIQEAFRVLGHTLSVSNPKLTGRIKNKWALRAILLCLLRTVKKDLYDAIARGLAVHEELCPLLLKHPDKDEARVWIGLYFTGTLCEQTPSGILEAYLRELGYLESDMTLRDYMKGYDRAWYPDAAELKTICRVIESAQRAEDLSKS